MENYYYFLDSQRTTDIRVPRHIFEKGNLDVGSLKTARTVTFLPISTAELSWRATLILSQVGPKSAFHQRTVGGDHDVLYSYGHNIRTYFVYNNLKHYAYVSDVVIYQWIPLGSIILLHHPLPSNDIIVFVVASQAISSGGGPRCSPQEASASGHLLASALLHSRAYRRPSGIWTSGHDNGDSWDFFLSATLYVLTIFIS